MGQQYIKGEAAYARVMREWGAPTITRFKASHATFYYQTTNLWSFAPHGALRDVYHHRSRVGQNRLSSMNKDAKNENVIRANKGGVDRNLLILASVRGSFAAHAIEN